jgi:hypothetical protein
MPVNSCAHTYNPEDSMRVCFGILALCVACSSPPQISIDASKAKSFVVYQEKLILVERKWAKADKLVPVTAELEAMRASTGLTEKEVTGLHQIATVITVRDQALKTSLDKQVAEQAHGLTQLPQTERDDAQKSLDNLKRMRANIFELTEMRKKYGDAIVEAMLEQQAELKRQRLELASLR